MTENNKKLWDEAIDGIDEAYTDEAVERLEKKANDEINDDEFIEVKKGYKQKFPVFAAAAAITVVIGVTTLTTLVITNSNMLFNPQNSYFDVCSNVNSDNTNIDESSDWGVFEDFKYRMLNENSISIISYSGDEKDVVIPGKINGKTVSAIEGKAFYRTDITSVVIPYGVSFVDYMAFGDCDKLVSVSLPDTLSEMGKYVFSGCDNLKNINLPQGIINIGEFAFENCKSLEEITIQSPLRKSAFSGCTGLKKVKLTKDVFYIEEAAFMNCTSLQEIVLPENLYELRGGAFDGCTSLKSAYISKDLTDIGACYSDEDGKVSTTVSPFVNCTNLEIIEVDPENNSLYSIDGVLFSKENSVIMFYPEGKKDTVFEIPEGTKMIGSSSQAGYTVFEGNKYLEKVIVPKSVAEIGNLAFANIEGEFRVEFPEDIEAIEIGTNAFNHSPNLVVCCVEGSAVHGLVMALGINCDLYSGSAQYGDSAQSISALPSLIMLYAVPLIFIVFFIVVIILLVKKIKSR